MPNTTKIISSKAQHYPVECLISYIFIYSQLHCYYPDAIYSDGCICLALSQWRYNTLSLCLFINFLFALSAFFAYMATQHHTLTANGCNIIKTISKAFHWWQFCATDMLHNYQHSIETTSYLSHKSLVCLFVAHWYIWNQRSSTGPFYLKWHRFSNGEIRLLSYHIPQHKMASQRGS